MQDEVDIVVLTNVRKSLGRGVELVIEKPKGDPWAFPFAHKRILAERVDAYELFIYSEDDTLITRRNIEAFLMATEVLPENEIAGFIRSERAPDGGISFSTVHGHFHWDPHSVVTRGPYTFASFTNEHSASYMLTRSQLQRAIRSGGFLVGPHQGRYHLPETAATDPYTQCGFKKMICISNIEDFVLPHLPNKYVGKLGLRERYLFQQIDALDEVHRGTRPGTALMEGTAETQLWQGKWSKSYYEHSRRDVLDLVPGEARMVLSYGCGWGELEADLVQRGIRVVAIPLDSVISACAEARGIEVVHGDSGTLAASVRNQSFDCVLVSNMLHLHPNPSRLLAALREALVPGGVLIAVVPNHSQLPIIWRRIKRDPALKNLGRYERTGTHLASARRIRRWFDLADLKVQKMIPVIPPRAERIHRASGKLLGGLLGSEFVVVGERT